jgi:ribokinase
MTDKLVAGVGRLNVDLIYVGFERLPNEGEELYCRDFFMGLGGGIPGSLVTLSRLGIKVKLGTWMGTDYLSEFAAARLKEEGITPVNLYDGRGIPVNVTSAMVTHADRTFITYGEPSTLATEKELYETCKGADFVLMQPNNKDVYKQLKDEGATLIFDPGYEEGMSFEGYKEYLAIADWYLPNRKEVSVIAKTDDPAEAAKVLSQFTGSAIVKLDSGGAYLYENGEGKVIPTLPAARKDSTGAGDAFLAGFVYGLCKGASPDVAIMCGNIAGSNCVTAYGCLTAKITEKDMLERLKSFYGVTLG